MLFLGGAFVLLFLVKNLQDLLDFGLAQSLGNCSMTCFLGRSFQVPVILPFE